ncbi:MAG: TolC family protein [Candidatus Omnitrophota bacterium]|nr:TolC family protein [Candidatus Omnitrophota bacterium]
MNRKRLIPFLFLLVLTGISHTDFVRAKATFPQVEGKDPAGDAANRRTLGLDEFVILAARNDTRFEQILIDELALKYRKAIGLPAGDLVFSVKSEYDYFPRQIRGDRAATGSLSKLFPYIGTEVSATYETTPAFSRRQNSSALTLEISQPIAENAFGRGTRLRSKIIGVEIDVARHQIVEAYEDYLAGVIKAYLAWYEAYENYKVGDSSYRENVKLLDNMKERMKSNIALPIDVNKITLQVLAKQETLIGLRTAYENALNFIETAVRYTGSDALVPERPDTYSDYAIHFDEDHSRFEKESRTAQILKLLEKSSSLSVKEEFDDLLPSINLQMGSTWDWQGLAAEREDHLIFAAVSLDWSIFEQVDRGEYNTAKVARDKTVLTTDSTLYRLYVDLKSLYQQIESQRELYEIAEEKIRRAQSVLEDETENYSFGKVTLNDYIDAVNTYDTNRFNRIRREVLVKTLIVEWLRLSDRLITRREIEERRV